MNQDTMTFDQFDPPLVLCYGVGQDSTGAIVGFEERGIRPDLIIFADVGSEKQSTYDYIPVINRHLDSIGFPQVTVVRYQCTDFKHWPPYSTLLENLLTNCTLPSIAYGTNKCSAKWKITPQAKYIERWAPAMNAWANGLKVRKAIGFDYSPKELKRSQGCATYAFKEEETEKYDIWFPLQEWQWDRAKCVEKIIARGLPVPPKSSCFFCTAMKPAEIDELPPDNLKCIVVIESRAALKHLAYAERKGWPKGVGVPMTAGLWRKPVLGFRGATPKPGSMTEYIRQRGLLPSREIDRLIAMTPREPMTVDQIESWATWLEVLINPPAKQAA